MGANGTAGRGSGETVLCFSRLWLHVPPPRILFVFEVVSPSLRAPQRCHAQIDACVVCGLCAGAGAAEVLHDAWYCTDALKHTVAYQRTSITLEHLSLCSG
ncbi:unnamed protein product [Hapterophycus canaliculatus]